MDDPGPGSYCGYGLLVCVDPGTDREPSQLTNRRIVYPGMDRHAGSPWIRFTHVDGIPASFSCHHDIIVHRLLSPYGDEPEFYFIGLYRLIRLQNLCCYIGNVWRHGGSWVYHEDRSDKIRVNPDDGVVRGYHCHGRQYVYAQRYDGLHHQCT